MPSSSLPSVHILVADDDRDSREILSRRLIRRGYAVTSAADGQGALDAITLENFDIVMLDHLMPDLTGLEVLTTIRQSKTSVELPVIMVTGKTFREDIAEATALGADEYVTKPVDFALAIAAIERQVARKR